MPYINQEILVHSWTNVATAQVSSKFFGLLEILHHLRLSLDKEIGSSKTYTVHTNSVASSLQDLFYFGDDIKDFRAESLFWITFSKLWKEKVLEIILKEKLNIFDVAVMCLYPRNFKEELSPEQLISLFKEEYHITEEINQLWFNERPFDLTFQETFNRRILKQRLIEALDIRTNYDTITVDSTFNVQAHAGELTRAPFIQTLYSGQSNLEILIITTFDFVSYYPFGRETKEQKAGLLKYHNRIIYGAAGTGKSYKLEEESIIFGERFLRITFHPDYTNAKFVGSYKPVTFYRESDKQFYASKSGESPMRTVRNEPVIDYDFVAGPFLLSLIEALKSPTPFLLIIEEINRANATAVFGDVFQLLDRNEGRSKYQVKLPKEAESFLVRELGDDYIKIKHGIYLPDNLYIWATMNSADQGVFPIDSAFKRRWTFEYLPINYNEEIIDELTIAFDGSVYNWNCFRRVLNDYLSANVKLPEDRLFGPFFLTKDEVNDDISVKNKLLLYIRDDLVRHSPEKIFSGSYNFSQLNSLYGQGKIFREEINELLAYCKV